MHNEWWVLLGVRVPNRWTGEYDDNEWESLLAQLIIGGATAYHPTAAAAAPPAWSPTDVAGLILWLDANTITGLNDGDSMASWEDQSTAGNDLAQTVAAQKPTYKENIKNTLPAILFDGNDEMNVNWAGGDLTQAYTLLIAANFVDTAADEVLLASSAGKNLYVIYRSGAHGNVMYFNCGTAITSVGAVAAGWHVVSAIANGANSELWVDTTSMVSGDAGAHACDIAHFGAYAGGSTGWNGHIAEVLFYDTALSDADRAAAEAYLNTKYAIY